MPETTRILWLMSRTLLLECTKYLFSTLQTPRMSFSQGMVLGHLLYFSYIFKCAMYVCVYT